MGTRSNNLPSGLYRDDYGSIGLIICPKCQRENYALNVALGYCTWCGYNANKDYNIQKLIEALTQDKEDLQMKLQAALMENKTLHNQYDASMKEAKQIIRSCSEIKEQYENLIKETKILKQQLQFSKDEIYRTKMKFKDLFKILE